MTRWRTTALLGVLAAAIGFSGAASAQPSASDKAAAEALYDEGKRLLDDKRFEEACRKFEASQKLDAGVGTLLHLGACYEQLGRRASAWATFREASSVARASGDVEREKIARERADKLEGSLFRLTIDVAPENRNVAGFSLQRGDEAVSAGAFGVPVPIDSGSYVVRASAPDHEGWSTTVAIPEGAGQQTLLVPPLTRLAVTALPPVAPSPVEPSSGPGPAAPGPTPDAASPSSTQLTLGIIVGSVGIVGLGIGGVAAAIAVGKDTDADDFCEGAVCSDQQGVELGDSARTAGDVATVGVLVGGVALAAGIVLVLTAPSSAESSSAESSATVALAPWFGAGAGGDIERGAGGVALRGSFQ